MINIDDVFEVYKGKVGCMCGCNGKYYTTRVEEANKECGYKYHTRRNPAKVREVVNMLNEANFSELEISEDSRFKVVCFDYYSIRYLARIGKNR